MRPVGRAPRGAVTARSGASSVAKQATSHSSRTFRNTGLGFTRLAVVPQKPVKFPKGFKLFKVKQPKVQSAWAVAHGQDQLESEFLAGNIKGVHHVALLCEDLEKSLDFYVGVLGLDVNRHRPHDKLPYRGAWLNIGPEMIHLMELPNPDKGEDRPEHGGRDRHFCIGLDPGAVEPLSTRLDEHGIKYTKSRSGRPAIFFRDPDENCLEAVELESWR